MPDELEKYRKPERKLGDPFTVRPTKEEDAFMRKHRLTPSKVWHGKMKELMGKA